MTTLIIKTTREPGWLDDYREGLVRSFMSDEDVSSLESAIPKDKKKYLDGDFMVIEASFDQHRDALRCLSKIRKLQIPGFTVTVDVVK